MSRDFAEEANKNTVNPKDYTDLTIASEDAFCCVAQFAAALSDQSKVVVSLEKIRLVFGLTKTEIFRLNQSDSQPRKLVSVGDRIRRQDEADALLSLAMRSDLAAGTVEMVETAAGTSLLFIVLQSSRGQVDVMQLTFPSNQKAGSQSGLNAIAPALVTAWSMRQPGLAAALAYAQSHSRRSRYDAPEGAPILSFENAYGLSRSEFRVCRLLATGLKPKGIADELDLSIATIRTHLRNIYAKTDLSGQLEVVSHIGRSSPSLMQAA